MRIKKNLIVVVAVVVVLAILLTLVLGIMGGIGPLGFVKKDQNSQTQDDVQAKDDAQTQEDLRKQYLAKMPGNAQKYYIENVTVLDDSPLKGKKLCFLGSSVTKGEAALDVSFVDYIAKRNSNSYIKEAVSGTTLVDNGSNSYVQRMINNIDPEEEIDVFICQLSTNDVGTKSGLGEISDSKSLEDFDTSTIIGAMEYIICYAKQTWDCPVVFYTGTKFNNDRYPTMVDALLQLQDKWDIGVIDLWNDTEMNAVNEEDYALYMADPVHPTKAGYLKWWTPKIEAYLYDYLQ